MVGAGGREHALAWKLAQSPSLTKLYACPGNPGIAEHATLVDVEVTNHTAVVAFCRDHSIDLVVVGPEAPLVNGLGDSLRRAGIAVFGPDKAAAQIEGSKGFTKDLCARAGIPTAPYQRFDDRESAHAGLAKFGLPVVIKADGLAAGKGVVIAETREQAGAAIDDMFGGAFGTAGTELVIEAYLTGEEVSFFALCDGKTAIPFASAQDHKRVGEGDTGLNTGGMGAYSPATVFKPELQAQVMAEIIAPTVAALANAGTPFVGVLFTGLMLTPTGPMLIEYNARFGDPETQAILPRFEGDLCALLFAVATGALATAATPKFSVEAALTVVMAARGYPATPELGGAIGPFADAESEGAKIFQAGTRETTNGLCASGGRVLAVTGKGPSIRVAQAMAYHGVDRICFPSGFVRRDIGWREIGRETLQNASVSD